jgi:NOL1/NOP2/fmu family ribosome biogenesis protein
VVTNAKANAFAKLRDYFDVILCDAPCSGEGLFRKDAGAVAHWSPERVAFNAARQRRIVGEVWPALKPGGTFIYSTCTFNRVENEDNVAWMKDTLGAVEDRHGRSLPEGIAANANGSELRIYPHRAGGEGFFAAALRKAGEAPGSHERTKSPRETGRIPDEIKSWIREPRRFEFIRHGDTVSIVPAGMAAAVAALEPVKPVSTGTQVAVMKGAIAIPAPELALSVALNREAFPELKLDREMALQYLRGATEFSQEGGKGFYLVTCEGLPLGFAKKTGRRFNNLLPKSWYIMKRL